MSALAQSPRRGLIAIGLVVAALAMGMVVLGPVGEMSDHGVGIIEFELSRTAEQASEFYGQLGEEGRDAGRDGLYLDFPYLVLYALAYAACCVVVGARAAERGMERLASWGRPLAIGSFVAAGCDVVENIALLQVLDGHTDQPWPGIAFVFASVKFVLLTLAGLYVIVGFLLTLRRSRPAVT